MISLLGRRFSPILPPKAILATFITLDVLATIIQIAGAALIGAYESDYKDSTVPNRILLVGLAIQVAAFTIFLVLLTIFVIRAKEEMKKYKGFTLFTGALYLSALLVYLRTIFRLAETSQGVYGYLAQHEAFFGALEFAPIVLAVGVLAVVHPGKYVEQHVEEGERGIKMEDA